MPRVLLPVLCLICAGDTLPITDQLKWRLLSENTSCGGDLGQQGSSGLDDCKANCMVDPRCNYATFTSPYDCSWASTCRKTQSEGSVAVEKIPSYPQGFYYTNTEPSTLPSNSTLSVENGLTLTTALERCASIPQCTMFSFDSTNPNEVTDTVTFYNAAHVIEPDKLYSTWLYMKNSSEIPFCDADVSQSFLSSQHDNSLEIRWSHCQGKSLHLRLISPNAKVLTYNLTQSPLRLDVPAASVPTASSNLTWDISVEAVHTRVQRFSLPVAAQSCIQDGHWAAALASTQVGMDCWQLNTTLFATGRATRWCNANGEWEVPNMLKCSSDRWSPLEIRFLDESSPQIGMHERAEHKQSLQSFLLYFPGNKVYGVSLGEVSPSACSNGVVNILGNLIDPNYRRFQLYDVVASSVKCENWSLPILVSIEDNQAQYVNEWVMLRGGVGPVTLSFEPSRLVAQTDALQFQGSPVTRISFSDSHEDDCFRALSETCGEYRQQNPTMCLQCAERHVLKSIESHCVSEGNWANDVEFWCSCKNEAECGGQFPEANSTA